MKNGSQMVIVIMPPPMFPSQSLSAGLMQVIDMAEVDEVVEHKMVSSTGAGKSKIPMDPLE